MITIAAIEPPGTSEFSALLATLHAACFDAPWSAAEIAKLLAMPDAFAGIATVDDAPAGFHLSRCAAGEAEIVSIGVDPAHRRTGLGRALLQDVFARARRAEATRVFVEVAADNTAALALYRQTGFDQVGTRPGYYATKAGPRDALVLRAALGPVSGAG